MDDWYTTHALLNNSGAVFFDISPHFISTNSEDELNNYLNKLKPSPKYPPIFAHFRPSIKYTFKKQQQIWENIINQYKVCRKTLKFKSS